MAKRSRSSLGETKTRAAVKAASWRVIATLTTMTIVFLFTHEWMLSLGVGFFEVVAKLTFYYIHERVWQKIGWGKNKHPLANIPVTRELDPQDREKIEQQLRELGYMD